MLFSARLLASASSAASPKAAQRPQSIGEWWAAMSLAEKIVYTLVSVVLWLGACVIVGRSHPEWPLGVRILAYVLLLFVYDIYFLWFSLRLVVAQARREPTVYSRLPRYAPILLPAKK
jgi:hypothetical protein